MNPRPPEDSREEGWTSSGVLCVLVARARGFGLSDRSKKRAAPLPKGRERGKDFAVLANNIERPERPARAGVVQYWDGAGRRSWPGAHPKASSTTSGRGRCSGCTIARADGVVGSAGFLAMAHARAPALLACGPRLRAPRLRAPRLRRVASGPLRTDGAGSEDAGDPRASHCASSVVVCSCGLFPAAVATVPPSLELLARSSIRLRTAT